MYVNRSSVDWLTFTTWDRVDAKRLSTLALAHGGGSSKETRLKQYRGQLFPKAFYGTNIDATPMHYMLRVWGDESHDAYESIMIDGLKASKCTRIDLQVTIPITWEYNARLLAEALRKTEDEKGGRGRKVFLLAQGEFDTVYIGSWKSEKFYRIYVKAAGTQKFLRFEVCYKTGYSEEAADAVFADRNKIGGLLKYELSTLKANRNKALVEFRKALKREKSIKPIREKHLNNDGRLIWLKRQVMPAIYSMIEDDEIGDFAAGMVRELAEYAKESGRFDDSRYA